MAVGWRKFDDWWLAVW